MQKATDKKRGYDGCMFYILCFLILVMVARRSEAQVLKGDWVQVNKQIVDKTGYSDTGYSLKDVFKYFRDTYKDTIRIHDTIYIPVPVYQVLDTQAKVYISHDNKPVLKPCFIVWQGLKQQTPQGMQWINQPTIKAIYSKRWKLIPEKKIQKIL